jgi:Tfp pilus assembly protein PilO
MARNSEARTSEGPGQARRQTLMAGARLYQRWSAQQVVRTVLGALVVANLVAAALVLFPPGGSAEDLTRQLGGLEAQALKQRANLERSQQHASAVERGRVEGDQFLGEYFLEGRTAFSTLLAELDAAATQSKIVQREHAFSLDPIEGSDSLSMMSVTAAYTGKYADLMRFVHEIDRSPRLLIIESLTAAPQAGGDDLNVSMKLDTFVRDNGSAVHGDGAAGQ